MGIELEIIVLMWFVMIAIVMGSATIYHRWLKKDRKAKAENYSQNYAVKTAENLLLSKQELDVIPIPSISSFTAKSSNELLENIMKYFEDQ